MIKLMDNKKHKVVTSEDYNYIFDKETGFFARWGKTKEDDPEFAPAGPEILDIEISDGKDCLGACKFCYKSNSTGDITRNMTLEQFKQIINKFPRVLTQVAFGIMNLTTNPDFKEMMLYCREIGVVPNFTMHGLDSITDDWVDFISKTAGATAVSIYQKEKSYNWIKALTDKGMKTKIYVRKIK